jgi:uncharacterized protein (TIGR04255 family)
MVDNYISQVILRIDFPSTPLDTKNKILPELNKLILDKFPLPEKREVTRRGFKIDFDAVQLNHEDVITEWYYFDKYKKRSVCISENYIFFDYREWPHGTFKELESIFHNLIDKLFSITEIRVTRLGLRYINQINLNEADPTNWNGYLNDNIITIFNMAEEKFQISKTFQTLELISSDLKFKFQYGMHNPDYPAPIKRKLFVLDYDGYCEYLQNQKEIKDNLSEIHEEIKNLFKKSIGPKLELLLKVNND